ncbi:hypothetical protein SKAU_G00097710 [Synaphobranchus kaupii]|uniref:Uncharacterized protein n=1 Tax=Synaphobranchus kaupii TaxID=118154 RepID=A0A9Q1FXR8_SYNKA|nr:hypothetical protein SKAU_G00097710 [Synaphobranchus kaupii]
MHLLMEDSEGNKEGPCRDGAQKTPQVSEECVLLRRLLLGLENMESRMDRMEEQLRDIAAMFSGGEGCLAQPQVKWQRKRREEEGGRKEEGKRDKEDPGEGTSGSEPEGKEADEVRVNVKQKKTKTMKGLWSSLKRRWQGRRTEEVQEGEKEKIVAALVRTRTAHVVDLNIVFGPHDKVMQYLGRPAQTQDTGREKNGGK